RRTGARHRPRRGARVRARRRVGRVPPARRGRGARAARAARDPRRRRPHRYRARGGLPGAARARRGRLRARGRHAVDGDRLPRGRGARRARGAAAYRAVSEAPPIREAIIVAEAGDPLRAVARVPLLVRTILALQRAGVERCTLVGSLSPPADARIRCALATAGGLRLGVPGVAAVVAAIVLLEASAVLDCSDGEIARLRFAESRLGHWLDVTGDTVVHVAVLAGIARRVALTGSAPGWPLLTALLLGVLGAFAVITWSDATDARRRRVAAWENQLLDRVLSPLTTRDWHV